MRPLSTTRVAEYQRTRNHLHRQRLRRIKARVGCVDCGLKNPDLLDFDHVPERGQWRYQDPVIQREASRLGNLARQALREAA